MNLRVIPRFEDIEDSCGLSRSSQCGAGIPCRNLVGMLNTSGVHDVVMGFLPPSLAVPDADHPGLMRAGARAGALYGDRPVELRRCSATDLAVPGAPTPDLVEFGFDTIDLSPFEELQALLARIAEVGRITDDDAEGIRAAIDGSKVECAGGRQLEVLHLSVEGLFMRTGGPNRMSVVPSESDGMNDHGAATSVHIDQDVYGTPLTQIMAGRAPELFRHDSPDGRNDEAGLMLVNLWIPLHQITQPLVIADSRSIDRRRHQLRFALPTGSFLDRDDDMVVNDIWTMLHDDAQEWYFRSQMDHRSAYVFNTLATAHGAGVLPGEDVAERAYRALAAAETAASDGDQAGVTAALTGLDLDRPQGVTDALAGALDTFEALIDEALGDPGAVCGTDTDGWIGRSRSARRQVERTSLEMRMVVSIGT